MAAVQGVGLVRVAAVTVGARMIVLAAAEGRVVVVVV